MAGRAHQRIGRPLAAPVPFLCGELAAGENGLPLIVSHARRLHLLWQLRLRPNEGPVGSFPRLLPFGGMVEARSIGGLAAKATKMVGGWEKWALKPGRE
jgi:hypothetical protein